MSAASMEAVAMAVAVDLAEAVVMVEVEVGAARQLRESRRNELISREGLGGWCAPGERQ